MSFNHETSEIILEACVHVEYGQLVVPATLKRSSTEFGRSMSFGVVSFPILCSLGWCPWILTLMGTGLDSGLEFPFLPAISIMSPVI